MLLEDERKRMLQDTAQLSEAMLRRKTNVIQDGMRVAEKICSFISTFLPAPAVSRANVAQPCCRAHCCMASSRRRTSSPSSLLHSSQPSMFGSSALSSAAARPSSTQSIHGSSRKSSIEVMADAAGSFECLLRCAARPLSVRDTAHERYRTTQRLGSEPSVQQS
jgi:hypothetical protein